MVAPARGCMNDRPARDLRYGDIRAVHEIKVIVRHMITPDQCRAARALLRMSQNDLAAMTKISAVTVRKFENQTGTLRDAMIHLIRLTLEAEGIEFISENGGGPGVRPRK